MAPITPWDRLLEIRDAVHASLALVPLILLGPWLGWRAFRRHQIVLQRRATTGDKASASVPLPEPSHELYRGTGFARARVEVQRRQRALSPDLDPQATVEATVRRLGFFTPAFQMRLELPVYLVLVDRISVRDQRARMVDELLDRLQAGGVELVRFDFDRDPRRVVLRSGSGSRRDLEELAGLYPSHRLAVFTDAAGFADPRTGKLRPWIIHLFSAWPERILLTPVPVRRWVATELDLAEAGFQVVPATEEGVVFFAEMLRADASSLPRAHSSAWHPPYPSILDARPSRFLERHPPDDELLSRLCAELSFYLGPNGYRWLCSLAVYPQLEWYFTLYLGQLLKDFDGRPVLEEKTLLALTRLPWLRHGSMPDWLRLRLLQDLPATDEVQVRDWMRTFLEHRETPGSRFRLDIVRPPAPHEGRDLVRLIKDLAHFEPPKGALSDQIFVSFLVGKKPDRLQVVAPRSWRKWVWEQGLSSLGPRTGTVLLLLILLTLLGGVFGGRGIELLAKRFSKAPLAEVTIPTAIQLRVHRAAIKGQDAKPSECLEAVGRGRVARITACSNAARERWIPIPSGEGFHQLQSFEWLDQCLSLPDASIAITNAVATLPCRSNDKKQLWTLPERQFLLQETPLASAMGTCLEPTVPPFTRIGGGPSENPTVMPMSVNCTEAAPWDALFSNPLLILSSNPNERLEPMSPSPRPPLK